MGRKKVKKRLYGAQKADLIYLNFLRFPFILILLALVICGEHGYAQIGRLRFEHVHFEQALPQNSVYAIAQDKTGFMWFGTADGLCRYDGRELKVYRHDPAFARSLPGNFVRSIFVDSKGRLWIGTESGLCCYFPEFDSFRRVVVPEFGGKTVATFAMGECRSGEIFFVATQRKWLRIHPETWTVRDESPRSAPTWINGLSAYGMHRIGAQMVFSRRNMLYFYRWNAQQLDSLAIDGLEENGAGSPVMRGNQLLMGTSDGVIAIDLASRKVRWVREVRIGNQSQRMGQVNALLVSPQGELLIGTTTNGLLVAGTDFSQATQYLPSQSDPYALSHRYIVSLCYDRNGNLWVGMDSQGIDKASGSHRFDHYRAVQDGRRFLPSSHVHGFAMDDEGYLYVGTHDGFSVIGPDRKSVQIYASDPNAGNTTAFHEVYCILIDSQKRIWIGTGNGLVEFERASGRLDFVDGREGGDYGAIALMETGEGNILVGSKTTTRLFNPETRAFQSLSISGMVQGITGMKQLTDGLICGTVRNSEFGFKGLFHGDDSTAAGRFLLFAESKDCNADGDGNVWVASNHGLVKWDVRRGTVRVFAEKDGLPNSVLYSVLPDGRGNLWISSNKGICRFNMLKETVSNYDLTDGLQSMEFNSNAFFISNRGEMFFGGVNGFNAFFPDSIVDNPNPPEIAITSCRVFHAEYQGDSSINALHELILPYDQNTLSFTLAPLDFTVPKKNLIVYRLLGLDSNWVQLGSERTLSFIALPPGDYVLQIKACNNDEKWTLHPRELRITIIPPLWKRTWFLVLNGLVLLVAFCFVGWYVSTRRLRKRVEELERERMLQNERTRIARDMHDDIGAGLSKISLMCEIANQGPDLTEGTKEKLQKVSFSARQIVANMNEIIWSMNPRYDRQDELISYFHAYAYDFFEHIPIDLSFEFPEIGGAASATLDTRLRRNLFLVFKEALNNIAKHSKAHHAFIQIEADAQSLRLTIGDDGVGFDGRQLPKFRNGLPNMKARLEEIGAIVEIDSAPQGGTRIHIVCQLERSGTPTYTTKV